MQPTNKRVLIKRDKLPEKKVGSIYLPDENSIIKYPSTGYVVVTAMGVTMVEAGDRVLFGENSYQYFDKERNYSAGKRYK
jgi:co-chaperonin GroES (HSP10)